MTTINSAANFFTANYSAARDHAAQQRLVSRKKIQPKTNSTKNSPDNSTVSIRNKAAFTGAYCEFRTMNNAIAELQYFLTLRESLNGTLERMMALESKPNSSLTSDRGNELLELLNRDWLKLGAVGRFSLPPAIRFEKTDAETLKNINNGSIKTIIGSFLQQEHKNSIPSMNNIGKIQNAITHLKDEKKLITKAISRIQIASTKLTDKATPRKTLQSRIQNYFSASKATNLARQLLVRDNDLTFLIPFSHSIAGGLALLD